MESNVVTILLLCVVLKKKIYNIFLTQNNNYTKSQMQLSFIDLFSGIGGFRIGFEKACKKKNIKTTCVFSSEIKETAKYVYKENFKSNVSGDITKIKSGDIPNFDILLAGFPCQAFSSAGNRRGFMDTRGTLFFEIERIIKAKKPKGFILENVEGLVKHDLAKKNDKIGRTLDTILNCLNNLGYNVTWSLLNAKNFGLAQNRNRIFIVGSKKKTVSLDDFRIVNKKFKDIQQKNIKYPQSDFFKLLLSKFNSNDLYGKSIKDKRGGANNIHSWDLEVKGKINLKQRKLLNTILTQRRRKQWALKNKIDWMDGMPLTLDHIYSFYGSPSLFEKGMDKKELKELLNALVEKGYLKFEYPKISKKIKTEKGTIIKRVENTNSNKGYNIVVGKLSFEISKIIDPNDLTPTLVATDLGKLGVVDQKKLRRLTNIECLRLFGFDDKFKLNINQNKIYDLFGNSIAINVVEAVSERLLKSLK